MDLLHVTTRSDWREWLSHYHDTADEVWIVSFRSPTEETNLPYGVAVEEALCFGWIDSTRRTVDAERYAQRFTPRRDGSAFSQANKERLAALVAEGQVHPDVLAQLPEVRPEAFEIPADIEAALRAEPAAWAFFSSMPAPYQRIRAAYVDAARRQEEAFEQRLDHLVQKSARGKAFGYGIERFFGEAASAGE